MNGTELANSQIDMTHAFVSGPVLVYINLNKPLVEVMLNWQTVQELVEAALERQQRESESS